VRGELATANRAGGWQLDLLPVAGVAEGLKNDGEWSGGFRGQGGKYSVLLRAGTGQLFVPLANARLCPLYSQ